GIFFVGRSLEKESVELRALTDCAFLGSLDDYNARRDGVENFCESVIQLMDNVLACFSRRRIYRNGRTRHSLRLRCKRSTQREAQGENGQAHRLEFCQYQTCEV